MPTPLLRLAAEGDLPPASQLRHEVVPGRIATLRLRGVGGVVGQMHKHKSETFQRHNLGILFNTLDYDGATQSNGDSTSDGEVTSDELQVRL